MSLYVLPFSRSSSQSRSRLVELAKLLHDRPALYARVLRRRERRLVQGSHYRLASSQCVEMKRVFPIFRSRTPIEIIEERLNRIINYRNKLNAEDRGSLIIPVFPSKPARHCHVEQNLLDGRRVFFFSFLFY